MRAGRTKAQPIRNSDSKIPMLQLRLGDQLFRRTAPHRPPALDDVVPVGDARQVLDFLVDHQHRLAARSHGG
jgi:hypothetical protein